MMRSHHYSVCTRFNFFSLTLGIQQSRVYKTNCFPRSHYTHTITSYTLHIRGIGNGTVSSAIWESVPRKNEFLKTFPIARVRRTSGIWRLSKTHEGTLCFAKLLRATMLLLVNNIRTKCSRQECTRNRAVLTSWLLTFSYKNLKFTPIVDK